MKIKLIVDGGAMKPGPAVAQQLGPAGINLGKLIADVNTATSGFKGTKVPVEIDANPKTKTYDIKVSSPPVSELIKKELKIESGSGESGKSHVGNISIETLIGIAKTKLSGMLAKDLKRALKLVVGSCVSMGVLVESKEPKEIMRDIESGKYDSEIKEEKTIASSEKLKLLESHFVKLKSEEEKKKKAAEEAAAAAEAEKAAATPATATATATPATATATATPVATAKPEAKKEAKK